MKSYATNLLRQPKYSVTEEFAAAVCDLSPTYYTEEYRRFLEKWGTHVILQATYGTIKIDRFLTIDIAFANYLDDKAPVTFYPNGTFDGRKVNFEVFESTPYYQKRFGKHVSTLNIGNDQNDQPVEMWLMSIDMMMQSKFWNKLETFVNLSLCNGDTTITGIHHKKSLVMQALKEYGLTSHKPRDKQLVIPDVWPKGTYGFPMAKWSQYSQPTFLYGAAWTSSGRIKWCTDAHDNDMAQSNHFSGNYGDSSLTLEFCMKREVSLYREDIDWPSGDYCIVKYGQCPEGFTQGYVQWKSYFRQSSYSYQMNQCNQQSSTIKPDGSYSQDILMYFCCRNDSKSDIPITLPKSQPFYLVRNNGSLKCQEVRGMIAKEEYIKWDNGNVTSTYFHMVAGHHPLVKMSDNFDYTMFFCYYYRKDSPM